MDDFDELDTMFAAKERVQLEIGWACNKWLDTQRQESGADSSPRSALTYALTTLSDRYSDAFSSHESARKNICTWMRVCRYFTKDKVEKFPGNFTFHHLRKCYVGGTWPGCDEMETKKRVDEAIKYAIENDGNWPPVNEIKEILPTPDDIWARVTSLCEKVAQDRQQPPHRRIAVEYVLNCERDYAS